MSEKLYSIRYSRSGEIRHHEAGTLERIAYAWAKFTPKSDTHIPWERCLVEVLPDDQYRAIGPSVEDYKVIATFWNEVDKVKKAQ
jgi:hypothetical protein